MLLVVNMVDVREAEWWFKYGATPFGESGLKPTCEYGPKPRAECSSSPLLQPH